MSGKINSVTLSAAEIAFWSTKVIREEKCAAFLEKYRTTLLPELMLYEEAQIILDIWSNKINHSSKVHSEVIKCMVSNADKVKKAVDMKIWQILVIGYDEPSNPDAVVMSDSDTTFMLWYFRNKFYQAIDFHMKKSTNAEKNAVFMRWYQDQPPQVPWFSLLSPKSIM